ncbi:MAG: MBL fold metallo-hydrolase [Deltaproteobacteria bacterium]|jgi:glyoxylase-like metal-dependent hydrolase (beta-lactamase superfamily II)
MAIIVKDEHIQINRLELGPFGTNSYILICQKTNESVVVDAPGEAGMVVERLKETQPKYILMTHDHFDHIGGLVELRSALEVPVAAHPADANDLPLEPDLLLNDGDEILIGAIKLRVLHTPGHTPGGLCFLTDKYLIAGDTLFPGGPGKTQSPDDFRQIIKSITEKLFELPEDTQVYPGHGEATTIKEAKQQYEVFSARPHDPNLCGDVVWTSS